MNTAIAIGSTIGLSQPGAGPTLPSSDGAGGASFGALIDLLGKDPTSPARHGSVTASIAATGEPDPAPQDQAALAELLDILTALSETLDDGDSLSSADLDALAGAISTLETLLAGKLTPAAGADDAGLIENLSALAAKLADQLRETSPDLANRLTALTRTLDAHTAAHEAAVSAEKSGSAAALKHIETQARSNPATVIAEAEGEADRAAPPSDQRPVPADPARQSQRKLAVENPQPVAAPPKPETAAKPDPTVAPLAATDPAAPEAPPPQPGTANTQISPTAAARPEAALYQRAPAQINLPHIAAEIVRHAQNGLTRFEIRLNPPELGRIDVRMEMDASGNVVARLAVERSETLDLLQRDQRALERALSDAGLDGDQATLEFTLSQDGGDKSDDASEPWRTSVVTGAGTDDKTSATNAEHNPYMRGYARLDAVNLWV